MATYQSMATRFLGLEDSMADPKWSEALILPVPFEKTSSFGKGSRKGPEALLHASHQVELYDTALGFAPHERCGGIATLQALEVRDDDDGGVVAARLETVVADWLGQNKRVITVAGEHTGVVGAIRAYARHFDDLTVLQIDAHSDMRESYLDDPWNHACAMSRVHDVHPNIVQVGIRSEAAEERQRVEDLGLSVFRCHDIHEQDRRRTDWIRPIIEACSPNVYVTFDFDAFDLAIMPATGTPEPGGMTWEQVNALFRRIAWERNVVGFDVSELAPIPGMHHPEFTAAKTVYRFLGYLYQ